MFLNNKIVYWNQLNHSEKKNILSRPKIIKSSDLKSLVQSIISNICDYGDDILYKYTRQFDNFWLSNFKVDINRIDDAKNLISKKFKNSVKLAKMNITAFHAHQLMKNIDINTQIGIRCQQIILPIESVGLYVPGGTAPLTSTVLMLSIPAKIAGCKNIVLCSPPPISNEILYVAKTCGINNIFQIGGAQAIAAMGLGTATIPKVNKIFGPGNSYVTEAKLQLSQLLPELSIDMIAGPSELLIIADDTASPQFIASDVLAQLEHGCDSQVIFLTPSINILKKVLLEIELQLLHLNRYKIIIQSLKNSRFILTYDLLECIKISNIYAPEHLIIQTENPRFLLKYVVNAGSVFLGHWSPESVGDYASGTNHVLPTHGSSVCFSGLSVLDFQKRISVQELTPLGLKNISDSVELIALTENMDAHKQSITCRVNSIKGGYGEKY